MSESITAADTNTCTDEPCDLYRFFDTADRLLYVGISKELPTRWRSHGLIKDWWPQVARATIEHYDSRGEAEEAEIKAILTEAPLYNLRNAPERQPLTAKLVAQYASLKPAGPRGELTPAEAAAELSVSTATVRRWEKRRVLVPSRRLPGSLHRRYSRSEVEALRQLIEDPAELARLLARGEA